LSKERASFFVSNRGRQLAAVILLAATSGAVSSADHTEVPRTPAEVKRSDECVRLHAELRKRIPDDERAQRDAWAAEKPRCAGTGLYEYLLGTHERNVGNDAAAIAIFEDAIKRKLPYYESVYVSLNTMRAQAAFTAKPPDLERVRTLRNELDQFAAAHRPDDFAYQQLASMNVALKDWPAAAAAARKSIAADGANARARRQLVVALHADKRCAEAVQEYRPALETSRGLLADMGFMLSAADCYFETGDVKNGAATLDGLLHANPAVRDDPGVDQLMEYAAAKGQPVSAPQ
jgi:tetratricopeptide (TPR) repeat protein